MQSKTQALRTLEPLAFRALPGVVADVWSVHGDLGGGGHYFAPDPRIVIFLDDTPPPMAVSTGSPLGQSQIAQALFMPADVPLWSRMQATGRMTHIDFHMDAEALQRRLASGGVRADLARPRLFAASPSLVALGRLAAAEIKALRRSEMLLDGLLTATLAEIFAEREPEAGPESCSLAPWQITAVERHVRANLERQIAVAEMAEVAKLSESWFAHCFRQTTGQTPQRWQANLRVAVARDLMLTASLSLAEIAHVTGFSDQAHLSRNFRTQYGQPPSAWRKRLFHGPVQMTADLSKTTNKFSS